MIRRCTKLTSLLACVLLLVAGCSQNASNSQVKPKMLYETISKLVAEEDYGKAISVLESADVARQVHHATNHNDLRWIAVFEDTLVVPGLGEETSQSLSKEDCWVVPGTSDAPANDAWQHAAETFAKEYNMKLKEKLAAE